MLRKSVALIAAAVAVMVWAGGARAGDDGEQVFRDNCFACHSLVRNMNKVGPSLFGVVGRDAASVSSFTYSADLQNSGLVWTEERLDVFLTNPRASFPGTRMLFSGLAEPADRAAVIAYLKTQK